MKPIYINGERYEYKLECYDAEYGDGIKTEFYLGTELKRIFNWKFWQPTKFKEVPKLMFTIWLNIESSQYSKSTIKKYIDAEIALIGRDEEIAKGNII